MNLFVLNANALQIPLADKSVNMCVTSPPYYGLRDYGTGGQIGLEETPGEYVQNMVQVFREVWRVMKDDGTLWLNLGDSYASNGQTGQTDESTGWKHGELENLKRSRSRGAGHEGLKPKDLIGIPWRVAFALQADGWYLRQDIIWHKPNPMPESVKDRCTKAHEYIFLLTKQAKYYYDYDAIMEESSDPKGTANRYKYKFWGDNTKESNGQGRPNNDANTSGYKNLKYDGQQPNTMHIKRLEGEEYLSPVRNKRSVWTVITKGYPEAHFATYPPDLITDCIKAGSKPGGVVLDPFNGSGTTGEVCARYGRNYVGVELNREYIGLTNKRLMQYKIQPELI